MFAEGEIEVVELEGANADHDVQATHKQLS